MMIINDENSKRIYRKTSEKLPVVVIEVIKVYMQYAIHGHCNTQSDEPLLLEIPLFLVEIDLMREPFIKLFCIISPFLPFGNTNVYTRKQKVQTKFHKTKSTFDSLSEDGLLYPIQLF